MSNQSYFSEHYSSSIQSNRMMFSTTMKVIDCDITVIKNTSIEHKNDINKNFKHINELYKDHIVKSPNNKQVTLNTTPVQKLKIVNNHIQRNEILIKEKKKFFNALTQREQSLNNKKTKACILFQSCYRGYVVRKHLNPSIYTNRLIRSHTKPNPNINEIREELCQLAYVYGLVPIRGLTLESKKVSATRRKKIQKNALKIIKTFLLMLIQRKRARIIVYKMLIARKDKAIRILQRFGKLIIVKQFKTHLLERRRIASAIVIQAGIKGYLARLRYDLCICTIYVYMLHMVTLPCMCYNTYTSHTSMY